MPQCNTPSQSNGAAARLRFVHCSTASGTAAYPGPILFVTREFASPLFIGICKANPLNTPDSRTRGQCSFSFSDRLPVSFGSAEAPRRVCAVEMGRKGEKAQRFNKSLHFLKGFVLSLPCNPFDNSGKPCNRWPIATTAFSPLPTSLLRFRSADNFLSSSRGQPKPAFFSVCAREFISIRFGITRRDICFSMQRPD